MLLHTNSTAPALQLLQLLLHAALRQRLADCTRRPLVGPELQE
jgi:hypothetical protein